VRMHSTLVSRVTQVLEGARYSVIKHFTSCFDVAAIGRKRLVVKALNNVDGLRPEYARDLNGLSQGLGLSPVVVGVKTKRTKLEDNVLYERFGIPVLSVGTFKLFVEGEQVFPVYSRGREIVSFDPSVFRRVREEKGLSLSEMAEALGVSKEAVYLYERGSLRMRREVADVFKSLFDVDIALAPERHSVVDEFPVCSGLSTLLSSFDLKVREFQKTGFDVVAFDDRDQIIVRKGIPRDPGLLVDFSDFFGASLAFLSEDP